MTGDALALTILGVTAEPAIAFEYDGEQIGLTSPSLDYLYYASIRGVWHSPDRDEPIILSVSGTGTVSFTFTDAAHAIALDESQMLSLRGALASGIPLYPPQPCARHNDRDAIAFTSHADPACRECYYGTGYDKEAS